ncbi:MAG TPA: hypothetical protein DCE44_13090, partial [Verrucomicrobiales bacterium]|nr:hypothetical protein [Verrucomicrobiales bacterium]
MAFSYTIHRSEWKGHCPETFGVAGTWVSVQPVDSAPRLGNTDVATEASPRKRFFGVPGFTGIAPTTSMSTGVSPPPRIPDHELLEIIGRGSYGEVWRARNIVGAERAVKVVWRASFGSDRPYEREFVGIQKFEPVSRRHEGLVDILHVGRAADDRYFYYVMELADNATSPGAFEIEAKRAETGYTPLTLRALLKARGKLPLSEVLELGVAMCGALGHLHRHGLVHRDVKPSNLLFVGGRVKLADIGLVAAIDEAKSFVGTEGYIPPEGPGAPSADLYSLG